VVAAAEALALLATPADSNEFVAATLSVAAYPAIALSAVPPTAAPAPATSSSVTAPLSSPELQLELLDDAPEQKKIAI
jgi:hypothetical protein